MFAASLPLLAQAGFQDAINQAETVENEQILSNENDRDLQSIGKACQSLLQDPPFPGCSCGADGSSNNIAFTCDNFCKQCRDDSDYCVTFSFFTRYTATSNNKFYPSLLRFEEVQTGSDSSKKTLIREQTYDTSSNPISCTTFIGSQKCDSCSLSGSSSIHDCRNINGISSLIVEDGTLSDVPLSSPFSSLNPAVADIQNCPKGNSGGAIPKKEIPADMTKDDSKLFGSDADRGGLNRKLKSKGR